MSGVPGSRWGVGRVRSERWDGVGGQSHRDLATLPKVCLSHFSHCASCPQTERDVSVRQRAVDLLYAMCDRSNAQQIVAEMLSYLETADYSIREEIVSPMASVLPAQSSFPLCVVLFWRSPGNLLDFG